MAFKRPVVLPFAPPQTRRALVAGAVLVRKMWAAYEHNLVVKPMMTRAVSSMAGLMSGDAIAQASSGERFDLARSLRVGLYAFCINGPLCYKFYRVVDKCVFPANPTSWRAVAAKTFIDQAIFSPPLLCVYLAMMKVMEGKAHESVSTVRDKAWPCTSAGFAFWIPAHVVNFKLVPDAYRSLAVLSMGTAWTAILSTISRQAAPAQAIEPMDSFLLEKAPLVAAVIEPHDAPLLDGSGKIAEAVESNPSLGCAPVVAAQIMEPIVGSFPLDGGVQIAIQASA
ncbi:hypothetical protein BSKO_03608 [Bryopsis sp. KO-2023]|nr:hypothetical protein BSKO_03608 [Bryopsis sp. KO-2023]